MSLPAPNLDDRRFQDLVDDAKRLVMRRCPEWTDHNVSDPGVTLIETFAYMTDQLLFRLNRVPDRLYVKFLDLIGLHLLPPTPATVDVTFWLSAPATTPLTITATTAAATVRTEWAESVVFSTSADLTIVPCTLQHVRGRRVESKEFNDHSRQLRQGIPFLAFGEPPEVGDELYLGLSEPAPRCAVRIDFLGQTEGVGIDPEHPPLCWEAWDGSDWVTCELSNDETGGLNRSGSLVVHLPIEHSASIVDGERAGWLRARVLESEPEQPAYSSSPVVHGMAAGSVGGTIEALHGEIIENELIGESEGVAAQSFSVSRGPVLGGAGAPVLEVSSVDGWQEWTAVDHFATSGPEDHHFLLDASSGVVHFGPAVRELDGTLRQYGAVPPSGASIRMRRYAIGGGTIGNIGKGAIQTLKSSIPYVSAVENRRRASGGVDQETLDAAKTRAPVLLRTRSRAVTAEDYEAIAREIAPEVTRVCCLTAGEHAGESAVDAGSVRVLVVPAVTQQSGRITLAELAPSEEVLARIAAGLDRVRLIGTRVVVEPPKYRGVTVVVTVAARPGADLAMVERDALDALYGFLNPVSGGARGTGWDFGRAVHAGDVFGVLQGVRGLDAIEDVRLFGANPVTGERGAETSRLELPRGSLVFSFGHQVRVRRP